MIEDGEPEPVGESARRGQLDARQCEHELVASVPDGRLPGSRLAPEQLAEPAQDHVAGIVAEGVVDRLEVVDVEDDDGHARVPQPRRRKR
jgi:hypothetical protein